MSNPATPPIPPITDPDLIAAVSALARSAHAYRSVLFLVVDAAMEGQGEAAKQSNPAVLKLLEHDDLLNLSDRVINGWRQQLGIEDD